MNGGVLNHVGRKVKVVIQTKELAISLTNTEAKEEEKKTYQISRLRS
jgi:hypothetical protein